jgi:hypothetical protein
MATRETINEIEAFVAAVPELGPTWQEHLADNDGEPLPHVFFFEVSRFAVEVAESGNADLRTRFADGLESLSASENEDVVNLIHVSFAENLVWGDDRERAALATLMPFFGSATRRRIEEFEAWASGDPPPTD